MSTSRGSSGSRNMATAGSSAAREDRRLSRQALESYLWGAANLLRGLVDAGDYKQYVFPLLFFKRLSDVWDEEHRAALDETGDEGGARATADDRFAVPAGAHTPGRGVAPDAGRPRRGAALRHGRIRRAAHGIARSA